MLKWQRFVHLPLPINSFIYRRTHVHIHTHTPPTHTPSTHTPMNHKHPFAIQSILVSSQPNHVRVHAAEPQSCQCLQRLSLSRGEESELQKAAEKLKRTFFIRRCIILTWGPGMLDCGLGSLICWIVEWGDKEERERCGESAEREGKEGERETNQSWQSHFYTRQN